MKKPYIILALKLAFITAALTFVFWKSDTTLIFDYLKTIHPLAFICSFLLLVIAQVISAFRTKLYFASAGIYLNNKFSIGLYFTGMLYNNILPGGVGGDAYKVYLIGKLADFPKLTAFRLILSDRGNGIFLIGLLTCLFAYMGHTAGGFVDRDYSLIRYLFSLLNYSDLVFVVLAAISIPMYLYLAKTLLKEKTITSIKASGYSFWVQSISTLIAVIILAGLGFDIFLSPDITYEYLVLFLISSVISVIPISIGGVGLRELTFLYGANILELDVELGIAIAIVFFFINLLCSLAGLLFWHKLEDLYGEKHGST